MPAATATYSNSVDVVMDTSALSYAKKSRLPKALTQFIHQGHQTVRIRQNFRVLGSLTVPLEMFQEGSGLYSNGFDQPVFCLIIVHVSSIP